MNNSFNWLAADLQMLLMRKLNFSLLSDCKLKGLADDKL